MEDWIKLSWMWWLILLTPAPGRQWQIVSGEVAHMPWYVCGGDEIAGVGALLPLHGSKVLNLVMISHQAYICIVQHQVPL